MVSVIVSIILYYWRLHDSYVVQIPLNWDLCLDDCTGCILVFIWVFHAYSELKSVDAVRYHEPHRCRTEMLVFWLNNFQPSWSVLIEALE